MYNKEWYNKLRKEYKPSEIKCLLIAESPPKSEGGRFFYNPDQEKYDFLFRSVMEVIFTDFKVKYRRGQKRIYLQKFKEKGFYLIDAVDEPINDKNQRERNKIIKRNLENKIREIDELISKDTPIIFIKKNIFKIFHPELKRRGFNVIHNKPIPFPSSGQQSKFKEKFKRCLEKISNTIENSR